MIKKTCFLLLVILTAVALYGCWNYRGVNEMAIVAGMAVDRDPGTKKYKLTFETIDLNVPVKQQGLKPLLIESEGETIFDAARNAKMRSTSKLYYGHMKTVVISEDIARDENIGSIIDWYLRDAECRETICFVVSQEKTARDLLSVEGTGDPLVSLEMQKILENDHKDTLSVPYIELYNVFNTINAEGLSLTLPFFHIVDSAGKPVIEANGTAVYKGEKMAGTLTPEESKYYLFAVGKVEGGVLTFSSAGTQDDTALEISKNQTKTSFSHKNGQLKIQIRTDTDVYLNDYKWSTYDIDLKEIPILEAAAQKKLKQSIQDVIKKVQTEYRSDIFGFGSMIRKQDLRLWDQFKDHWEETFAGLEVDVQCKVNIVNTASVKE